jgi:sugar lactone lactonase YvrE
VDSADNLFIADTLNARVRKVAAESGLITTVAGTGVQGSSGDGGPAIAARLSGPWSVAVDSAGNLFIADYYEHRIRMIAAATGIISTVAGTGERGFSGDGGLATAAKLLCPIGITVDLGGNLFIAEEGNQRIRKVSAATGIIITAAGTGERGFSGDGGPATAAKVNLDAGLAADSAGNLFIADRGNNRIRKIAASTGIISTVAGTGEAGFSGDGGPATAGRLYWPTGAALDTAGNLIIADSSNRRIRWVAVSGVITTLAGIGKQDSSGDAGPATAARLYYPTDVASDAAGNVFIADLKNHRVRKVAAGTAVITTVAGTGEEGFSGDGGPATAAKLNWPDGLALQSTAGLFVADGLNSRIRAITFASGIITTVAGDGVQGFSGDGGPATAARLFWPRGLATDAAGNLYIADWGNNRIRKLAVGTGIITTAAGNGESGFSGDGGPATEARLDSPLGVAVDAAGNLFIADYYNRRIRKVAGATGIITTVAGGGSSTEDGGPATAAILPQPYAVAVDASGNMFIADTGLNRIRKVAANTGIITTVAGTGVRGFSGDGGPATASALNYPVAVCVDSLGNLFIADSSNDRVRVVRGPIP